MGWCTLKCTVKKLNGCTDRDAWARLTQRVFGPIPPMLITDDPQKNFFMLCKRFDRYEHFASLHPFSPWRPDDRSPEKKRRLAQSIKLGEHPEEQGSRAFVLFHIIHNGPIHNGPTRAHDLGGNNLQYASPELKNDRSVVLTAMESNRPFTVDIEDVFPNVGEELRGNKDFVMSELWTAGGRLLRYASPELKDDKEVVLEAMSHWESNYDGWSAFNEASERLQQDPDVRAAEDDRLAALASAEDDPL